MEYSDTQQHLIEPMKKPNESTVYVVTTGEYSDYSIRGVFSSREAAEKFMAKCKASEACWNQDFNELQEWALDDALKERAYTRFNAGVFLDDGSVEEAHDGFEYWGVPETSSYIAESVPCHGGRGVARSTSHKSKEHAMKVAAEARQKWLRSKHA